MIGMIDAFFMLKCIPPDKQKSLKSSAKVARGVSNLSLGRIIFCLFGVVECFLLHVLHVVLQVITGHFKPV